jgi:FeS assembly SUF system protein
MWRDSNDMDPNPDRHKQSLTVLPGPGKIDQLSRQMPDTPAKSSTTEPVPSLPRTATDPANAPASGPNVPPELRLIEGKVIEAVRQVYDPEIPVNIYELGLIYAIEVKPDHTVNVRMTLTTPACPVAGSLPGEVQRRIEAIDEVTSANIELVWDPPWDRSMMSEAAMLQLGMF